MIDIMQSLQPATATFRMGEIKSEDVPMHNKTASTILLAIASCSCYAEPQWNIQLEPMYIGVLGNEGHAANISTQTNTQTSTTTSSSTPGSFNTTTTTSSTTQTQTKSLNFNLPGQGTLRGQIEFAAGDWGAGISGWWFDADDSFQRALNSGPTTPPSSVFPPPSTTTSSRVLYDSNNFSLVAPPSNSGGVLSASATDKLSVWNIDFYGIKTLAETPSARMNLTFGVKVGSIDKKLSESANQSPATITSSFGSSSFSSTTSFDGRTRGSTDADTLAGPSIGIQANTHWGRHRIEGFLSQSVLIGDVKRKAALTTTQASLFTNVFSFPPFFTSSSTNSFASQNVFSDSERETVAIPVTEMKVKYLYDVTTNLSLGAGMFASIWVDTPGLTTARGGFLNKLPDKTLVFLGGMAAVSYRF